MFTTHQVIPGEKHENLFYSHH